MALTDNVFFNTLERALSSDINEVETLGGRNLMDSLRWIFSIQSDTVGAGMATSSPRSVVAGGLQVAPAGNDVAISPGVLMQQSATLTPTPTPLDSSYRFGRLGTTQIVTMPSPGANTYYLLEAQVVQVLTSSQSRDIFDPSTQTFVPTTVPKRYEFQVQFQLVTGSSDYPAPSGGDWVVLAGIFRPSGGGPVLAGHIVDLSQRWSDYLAAQQKVPSPFSYNTPTFLAPPYLRTIYEPGAAVSNLVVLAADVIYRGKQYVIRTQNAGIDLSSAAIVAPGVSLTANTWYYVYLYSVNGQNPRGSILAGTCNGVLVLRDVAPTSGGAGGVATLPAPFGGISATEGVCIGAILRNATNNGWEWQTTVGDTQIIRQFQAYSGTIGSSFVAVDLNAGTRPLPFCRSKTFDVSAADHGGTFTQIQYSRTLLGADIFRSCLPVANSQFAVDVVDVPEEFGNLIGIQVLGSASTLVLANARGFKWWGSR